MRVLIIHNQLWAHYKSKLFSELYALGASQNVQIHVAQIARTESSRTNLGNSNVDYNYDYELLFDDSLDNVRFWPKLRRLFQKFSQFRPDVLNITGYYDYAQVLLMAYAKLRGVRVIISNESGMSDHKRLFIKELPKKIIVALADGFFCFGTSSVNYLKQLGATDAQMLCRNAAVVDDDVILQNYEKVKQFPSSVSSQNFSVELPVETQAKEATKGEYSLPERNFIFVGRFVAPKNLKKLLLTFHDFVKKHPNWGLILLGEGEQKADLQQIVETNEIPNVSFVSGKAWHEVPRYLALADVLVLPSTSEPWGLVVNEAMICGMPVLVSKQSGCAEDLVQDGVNGQTFDANDSKQFLEKMMWFAQNEQNFSELGTFSRNIVAKFSVKAVAQQMIDGFRNISQKQ